MIKKNDKKLFPSTCFFARHAFLAVTWQSQSFQFPPRLRMERLCIKVYNIEEFEKTQLQLQTMGERWARASHFQF